MAEHEELPARFGVGDPDRVDRVNWGAFFFGWVWALAYGAWPWFIALLVYWVMRRIVLLASAQMHDASADLALAAALALGYWGLSALLAVRANRIVWRYEQGRVAGVSHAAVAKPALTVSEYLASQRTWGYAGLSLFLLTIVLTVPWAAFTLPWSEVGATQLSNIVAVSVGGALLLRDVLSRRSKRD